MTRLNCNVTSCGNNYDNCCCRRDIKISGENAESSLNTCCSSYVMKSSTYANLTSHFYPNPNLHVVCEVRECKFNSKAACTANEISINPFGQIDVGNTQCASFIKG